MYLILLYPICIINSTINYCESPGLRLRPNRACTNEVLDIRRANLYEQAARQCGLLIQVGDCGSAQHGAIDFHAWWCLRKQTCPFTVFSKVMIQHRQKGILVWNRNMIIV